MELHEGIPSVTLIGVGGIGTALLPVLARLKPKQVIIWDDDLVKPENLVNQLLWDQADIGKHKSVAAAERLAGSDISVSAVTTRYDGTGHFDTIVIAAVDSMESRRLIWEGVKKSERTTFLLDGRLSRETPYFLQLFAIQMNDPYACTSYEEWLVGDGEPDTGRRDIDMVPAPLVLSGFIGTLLVRGSRGDDLPWQIVWDGMSMTLVSFFSERS